jgi:NTP pyrophosphatase (non-canonical NTP hydrolase)
MKGKSAQEIKEEFEGEVGDVLCHVLLLAKHFDIDLDAVIERKWFHWKKT